MSPSPALQALQTLESVLDVAEDAIVLQLRPIAELGVRIDNTPDSNAIASKMRLFVYWDASTFGGLTPSLSANHMRQLEVLRYRVNLEMLDLRSHRAAYPLIRQCQLLLAGFAPIKEPIRLESSSFIRVSEKRWFYSLLVAFEHNFYIKPHSR